MRFLTKIQEQIQLSASNNIVNSRLNINSAHKRDSATTSHQPPIHTGDSMEKSNCMKFSARDVDNDVSDRTHCATRFQSGWWHEACMAANPNGKYLVGHHNSYGDGVNWRHFRGYHYSLKMIEMKIRLISSGAPKREEPPDPVDPAKAVVPPAAP